MTTKHTPGPWILHPMKNGFCITGSMSNGLNFVSYLMDQSEAIAIKSADARLIAAAPDLLAALRAIAPDDACPLHPELLSPFPGEPEHAFNDRKTKYGRKFEAWKIARAAIAKAEGKQ